MENASKALLIAGAILIAIVLISLGVMILGQGSDLVKNANMSDTEITAYNREFEQYLGDNIRGNVVRQLLTKVQQHNRTNADDYSKLIDMVGTDAEATNANVEIPDTGVTITLKSADIATGRNYKVTADYSSTGLITKIYVKLNS